MESSSSPSSMHMPARSISLPTKLIHPNSLIVDADISNFQSLESLDSASIQLGVTRLTELYNSIEEILRSPQTQQALHHRENTKLIEEALGTSIGLLDACEFTRDLISMLKEQVQDLQSALRRKGGNCSTIKNNINAFISFRKTLKKKISKHLRALKRMESSAKNAPLHKHAVVDYYLLTLSNALRQSSALAISLFRSLLSYLEARALKTKGQQRCTDITLCSFYGIIGRKNAKIDVQMELKTLEALDERLTAIQDDIDYVSRRLIQHRVCLLNILTP